MSDDIRQDPWGSTPQQPPYPTPPQIQNPNAPAPEGVKWVVRDGDDFPKVRTLNGVLREAGANTGVFIAGGCFKHVFEGRKPRDIDMYFTSPEAFEQAEAAFLSDGYEQTYQTDNATGIHKAGSLPIDLVTRDFRDAESTLADFDFTLTKCAYRFKPGTDRFELVYHPTFFEDLVNKRLVIDDRMVLPINTFQRLEKYTRYGYSLCRESKVKLLMAIRGWQPHRQDDTEEDGLENALNHSLYEAMD